MNADGKSDVTFALCILLFILYNGDLKMNYLRPSPTKSIVKLLIKEGDFKIMQYTVVPRYTSALE
jgi:hypothetical protein